MSYGYQKFGKPLKVFIETVATFLNPVVSNVDSLPTLLLHGLFDRILDHLGDGALSLLGLIKAYL